jgi:curved DNA-binding protein CbpA
MPPRPSFDYCTELEIERDAAHNEITISYRRLALLHYRDRNLENLEAATVKFQRVGSNLNHFMVCIFALT